jgi:hypothetical protein
MPENIGSSGPYNTRIPRQDENADIQTALRLYHYGSDINDPSQASDDSIVGHLSSLDTSKLGKDPSNLLSEEDLDQKITTGYYVQTSTANARTGSNYPEAVDTREEGNPLLFFAGLLKVVNDGNTVFQEYHMIGDTGYVLNKVFWRVKYAGSFSSWVEFVSPTAVDATVAEHSYSKTVTYTIDQMNSNYSPRLFVETSEKTSDYALTSQDVNKVINMNVAGGGTLTIQENLANLSVGSVINVYNSSPEILTIAAGTNVVIRNNGTLEQYKEASLRYRGGNEWVAAGPLY